MSDQYPRVVEGTFAGGRDWHEDEHIVPTHKVVPADAIVIEPDALPIFTKDDAADLAAGRTAEQMLDQAYEYIAAAEYLTAHPPINQAHVTEVHLTIQNHVSANVTRVGAEKVLRDLQAQGWTKPEVSK